MYEIILPYQLEIWLASVTNRLSEEEKSMYNSLKELEHILGNSATLEELYFCRTQRIPEIYRSYTSCRDDRFKPDFHREIHKLINEFDKRIKTYP